ncbi:hypothetical protein FB567DRAFT_633313 [Paraphoma chrysanthemicola]|uniref:DUF6594 domain-containing protein n=1 Tax=Paraphoma chrysanthemicola TaxID=798071 RepID=A0A8K0VTM1_9PLEO|nr:hypothetical protein FB567DRAFT_633313 [Paraphoma chrysanthemicola]
MDEHIGGDSIGEPMDQTASRAPGDAIIEMSNLPASSIHSRQPLPSQTRSTQVWEPFREVNIRPWHEYPRGYPRLAAFQSSKPKWSMYRGFGYLHSRVILNMQDEIGCLEDELITLDEDDYEQQCHVLMSREYDLEHGRCDDDELLVNVQKLNTFQKPSRPDYRGIRAWFWNERPLSESNEQYIKRRDDLISFENKDWSDFDKMMDVLIRYFTVKTWSGFTQKIFTTPEDREEIRGGNYIYLSQSRVEGLVNLIVLFSIFVLLVLPVIIMYSLISAGDNRSRLNAVGILVLFTLLFSGSMGMMTKAKRHELFAASAAYCAVLVVFISNFSNET